MTVTVVGLGSMGSALATTLAERGHRVTVWNRTRDRARRLADRVRLAASAEDAVLASDVTIVCVTDQVAAEAVLRQAGAVVAGRLIVNVSTGTPAQAREIAVHVRRQGGSYLAGGIQAQPDQIGTEAATILVAGSSEDVARAEPALSALGTLAVVGQDAGDAALLDHVLLGLWYDAQAAVLEAVRTLGDQATAQVFVPFAQRQLRYVVDGIPDTVREVEDGSFPRGPASLGEHRAALTQLRDVRRSAGVDLTGVERLLTLVDDRIQAGHPHDGFTSIVAARQPAPSGD